MNANFPLSGSQMPFPSHPLAVGSPSHGISLSVQPGRRFPSIRSSRSNKTGPRSAASPCAACSNASTFVAATPLVASRVRGRRCLGQGRYSVHGSPRSPRFLQVPAKVSSGFRRARRRLGASFGGDIFAVRGVARRSLFAARSVSCCFPPLPSSRADASK